ncbi:fructose-1,6-bisphosphatase class 1/Sedoheputulose-1,7-bisphosphatase [Cladochytrium replicatum]|nr:fructose-1,6-bisphosphatase class 1/Sedoheputulose-1,7-bisphosphatase [Cladochytrium replicatum]
MSEGADTRTDILPLTTHILSQQQRVAQATGDLTILLTSIAIAAKWISNVVRKADLLKVLGVDGGTNVQGEAQQKLDVLSNQIMINMLRRSGKTAILVSEENDEAIFMEGENRGSYCVVFDPLDGSSNIDCGVSIGTIFGIYKIDNEDEPKVSDVLRPGTEMVAAGYCMYGSSTVLVLTIDGKEVNGYTLDPNIGEFILTHRAMKLGKKKIFSVNEGHASKFDSVISEYVHNLKFPPAGKEPYSARYVGSMVADIHRTILYGGVFLYPTGKLRLLYEGFPMSMLIEAAGGKASTGRERVLSLLPKGIHARSGIYLGDAAEVDKIEAMYREADKKASAA